MLSPRTRILLLLGILGAVGRYVLVPGQRQLVVAFPSLPVDGKPQVLAPQPGSTFVVGLATSASGLVALVDPFADRVEIRNRDGSARPSVGHFGQEPGALDLPWSADWIDGVRLAVLDKGNDRVEVFDSRGRVLEAVRAGVGGLKGLAAFSDGTFYVGRNGSSYGGDPTFSVFGLDPHGRRIALWSVDQPVLDVRREIHGRVWVLQTDGLFLYDRGGRLVRAMAVPSNARALESDTGLFQRVGSAGAEFKPESVYQGLDGKVYLAARRTILVYDDRYAPLGALPASALPGGTLDAVAVDSANRVWIASIDGSVACIGVRWPAKT